MFAIRSAVIPVLASFLFAGCTHLPATQPVKPEVLSALQPVEVKVGINQPELYAAFVRSTAGASGAAACAAVPGFGILLAAACGGAFGAVDASVNAARAKAAEESVRPLKDELVDVSFDQLMRESITQSLQTVPGMQLESVAITKTVSTPRVKTSPFSRERERFITASSRRTQEMCANSGVPVRNDTDVSCGERKLRAVRQSLLWSQPDEDHFPRYPRRPRPSSQTRPHPARAGRDAGAGRLFRP